MLEGTGVVGGARVVGGAGVVGGTEVVGGAGVVGGSGVVGSSGAVGCAGVTGDTECGAMPIAGMFTSIGSVSPSMLACKFCWRRNSSLALKSSSVNVFIWWY